jgi:hypothetical protein
MTGLQTIWPGDACFIVEELSRQPDDELVKLKIARELLQREAAETEDSERKVANE